MLKRFTQLLAGGCLLLSSGFVQAEETNPYEMIQQVANKTFARIKSERSEIEKNPELLRTIMEDELLPHIDYNFSALKVLGNNFKKVPRDRIPEYIAVFRSYLITTYASALSYYKNQQVEFQPTKELDDETAITVRAIIKDQNRPDINLSFKLRKNKRTNEWKTYDMVAEGISMLSSKQSEFESILRKDGIQAVIDSMKSAIDKPLVLESK
ncbi:ABC transporter substrate-binding protein [Paraglaciecola aquimarina]|uniref:ABC transporter substrate-binding protein n=1 Tax=Paraglaciecola aquimarina TaxID=1235557 RepID=A0ABU3SS73_9ALTE|nr:ABC transporter substrate-binding protein [Paraglaciecola aquimarina]MDU0352822.1 ABC transporter substrate-binding protein [Paraglaciecola aquimarina]